MIEAYIRLHEMGRALSVEVWMGDILAGGLYGVEIGAVFSAESMFSQYTNTSKLALIALCQSQMYKLIDCQVYSAHVASMGAKFISGSDFRKRLRAG
jgi:leucyl/phenylalanyl-tRNA--protein transferase